jgi:hypothetical protein
VTFSVMTQQRGGKGGRYDLRELRDAAIEALLDIVTEPITADSDRSARGTKVAAASRLLSHTEWAEERAPELQFLKLFKSEKDAARYLVENHARLLALVGVNAVESNTELYQGQTENGQERTEQQDTLGETGGQVDPESGHRLR